MTEAFEATLSLDAIARLCDRLGLPAPLPLGSREALRVGGPVADEAFDVEGGLAFRDVIGVAAGQDELAGALAVLGAPEILISVLRQGETPGMATSICVCGERAAELRPVGAGGHLVALFPVAAALGRVTAFCDLVERPVPRGSPFRITVARLRALGERVAAGDLPGASAVLAGGDGSEEARRAFLRAFAARQAACQVAVLDRRVPGRLQGTVTAWLDGDDAGLWRIPPADPAAIDVELDVGPVTAGEIIAEIIDGFPELLPG